MKRSWGVVAPLFSLRSEGDGGIGDLGSLRAFARFVRESGGRWIALLPLGPMPDGETSPYSAHSSFAIDPIYMDMRDVAGENFCDTGTEGPETVRVNYADVRGRKRACVAVAYERFIRRRDGRAILGAFVEAQASWLKPFARFELFSSQYGLDWQSWPKEAMWSPSEGHGRNPRPDPLIERVYFEQWVLHTQWTQVHRFLTKMGVRLIGDLPFVVGKNSADVWSNPSDFYLDRSLGVPADALSDDGQDWQLPPYNVQAMREDGFRWIRARAHLMAKRFDAVRIDHVVGLFRQYVRREEPAQDSPFPSKLREGVFDPSEESAQSKLGETLLRVFIDEAHRTNPDLQVIAEDLGIIPPFVRETLTRLSLPGYRVLPWERFDGVYRDPKEFPACSVACWSTHDTSPITTWWEKLEPWEREGMRPYMQFDGTPLQVQIETLFSSGSDLALLTLPELVNDPSRINTPGTIGAHNWTYRMSKTVEAMDREEATSSFLQRVSVTHKRAAPDEAAGFSGTLTWGGYDWGLGA